MKRTCNNCIALDPVSYSCNLFYKNKKRTPDSPIFDKMSEEECPKPRTIREFVKLGIKIRYENNTR